MVTWSEFKTWVAPKLVISYTFFATGLIINLIQLLTYVVVRPFSRIWFKRLNNYLAYILYSNMTAIANYWSGMELELYCSDEDFKALGKENSFCVVNHKYDIDWLIAWVLCQRVNMLGGTKVVVKDALKYVPVLGWSWVFCEFIFVKRVWDSDHRTLERDIKAVVEYPPELHYAITIFCESTRFTKEKHAASLEVARHKGLPPLKHHLLPRPKGFNLVGSQLADHVNYLYDFNIAVRDVRDGRAPTMVDVTNGVPVSTMVLFRRIPMAQVPRNDEKKAAEFLNKLYAEKDNIHETFVTSGDFGPLGVKKQSVPKDGYDLLVALASFVLVFLPSAYYFALFFWHGSLLLKATTVGLVALINLLTNWMINKADSGHASSFGLKPAGAADLNNNHLKTDNGKKSE